MILGERTLCLFTVSQRVYKQYFFTFREYCSLDEMAHFGSLESRTYNTCSMKKMNCQRLGNFLDYAVLTLINVAPFQWLRRVVPSIKWPCLKKTFE